MLFIGLPLTLIVSIDFKKRLRKEIILAPTTAAWVGLLVAQIVAWAKFFSYRRVIRGLHLTSALQVIENPSTLLLTPVKGRNTVHCSLTPSLCLINRFVMTVMALIWFFYLGIFLKVYVLYDRVSWVQISPVSLAPFVLCYCFELLTE